jgi:hypothetical protein
VGPELCSTISLLAWNDRHHCLLTLASPIFAVRQ